MQKNRPKKEKDRLKNNHSTNGFYNNVHLGHWIHQRKDGTYMHVEITAHLVEYDGRKAKLVLANDRTQSLLAEEEIIKTNERYSFVSKATFDAIWDWDLQNNSVQWNHVAQEMFGYSENEIMDPDWWYNNIHQADKERVTSDIQQRIPVLNAKMELTSIFSTAVLLFTTNLGKALE